MGGMQNEGLGKSLSLGMGFVRFWTKLGGDFWWGVLGWGGKRLIWRGLRWVGV